MGFFNQVQNIEHKRIYCGIFVNKTQQCKIIRNFQFFKFYWNKNYQ